MVTASRAGQEKIRDANNRKILHLLMKERELSKQEMAKLAGLSVPTVTSIVTHLIEEGIVEEAGGVVCNFGRSQDKSLDLFSKLFLAANPELRQVMLAMQDND